MTETNPRECEISVEKLVYGGEGLARLDRQVVLTPRVLPGETVRVAIAQSKPQLLKARPIEVLTPSPERQAAPCPHFGICGGCHYQHTNYAYQLQQKLSILREVIQRLGKFAPPENIDIVAGPEFNYRNRAQFHFNRSRIGFHELDSEVLREIDTCAICSPRLNEALDALRGMAKQPGFPNFLKQVELFTNETDVQINVLSAERPVAKHFFDKCERDLPGFHNGSLTYQAAGHEFRVSASAFFQVNRFLIDRLIESALQGAEGSSAVDLYAGVGLFTVPLAERFEHVTAVETGAAAWRDLCHNAETARVAVTAIRTSAEAFMLDELPTADFVLADPPRAGLGKDVVRRLLEWKPRQLTIVSCDPSTLARDLAKLSAAYQIESMTMVDLFPQTYHIETITRLRLDTARS